MEIFQWYRHRFRRWNRVGIEVIAKNNNVKKIYCLDVVKMLSKNVNLYL